jgi:hypothetical protein
MVIFHSYVSLPEGRFTSLGSNFCPALATICRGLGGMIGMAPAAVWDFTTAKPAGNLGRSESFEKKNGASTLW